MNAILSFVLKYFEKHPEKVEELVTTAIDLLLAQIRKAKAEAMQDPQLAKHLSR